MMNFSIRVAQNVLRTNNLKIIRSLSSSIRFAQTHEYIKVNGNIGTIGITQHAAGLLGDIVYVDMPSIGAKYDSGDSFGSVESVKAASDVYTPLTGEVVEVNEIVSNNPGIVNEDPLENGWFMKIKIDEKGMLEFNKLLTKEQYDKHVEQDDE